MRIPAAIRRFGGAGVAAACAAIAVASLTLGASGEPLDAVAAPGPASGGAHPRALVAFLPADPGPDQPLLSELAGYPDLALGLTSPTVGGYSESQTAIDMSQGARLSARAYSTPLGRLDLAPVGRGGQIEGWQAARSRADDASTKLTPGLLGSTVERSGGRVAYAGQIGTRQVEAVVAADESGRIARVSLGTIGTFAERVLGLWRSSDLLVARLPEGDVGLGVLEALLAARRSGDLIYVMRAPPRTQRLLPTGIAGPGFSGSFRSETTRTEGLVAASDVAPTLLRHLGMPLSADLQGEPIEATPGGGAEAAQELSARLTVIVPRRDAALRWAFVAWLVLLGTLAIARRSEGVRTALRIGFLQALWLPGLALVGSALAPTQAAELAILALGGLALGAVSDRFVPWPAAPALPAAVVLLAHAVDLAAGSSLIASSLAGPNPRGGARFYGLGNELETILAVSTLLGTGAACTLLGAPQSRWIPRIFALTCLVAGVIIGAGRLGAAVGGVITLGAGGAAAVVASLPGGATRRRIAVAIAAPLAALAALVVIDLATAGGAHFTRSVIAADSAGALLDVAQRRFELSFAGLVEGTTPVSVGLLALLLVVGAVRRERVLRPLDALAPPAAGAFRAGLVGAVVATIVGALANDSGPVIFLIGSGTVVLAVAYVNGRPAAPSRAIDGRSAPARRARRAPSSEAASGPAL